MAITAESRQDIIELVVTAYGAAPGTTLLTELVAIIDNGGTLSDVADNLTSRSEWTSVYPSFQTAEEFANEWLGNLLPEASAATLAGGVDIVVGLVNGGSTFGEIIIAAQDFLSAVAETDADYGVSAANFNNKVEVATYYTITLEEAAQSSTTLSGVTSDDATVTTAKAAADTAALPAADAGASYTLLTGLDSKTLGTGDDSAFAVDSTTAASDTFNVSDSVDGAAGTDTFYLTIDSITGATSYTPSRIDNFEKFSVTNVDATPDAVTINANLMSLNSVEVSASTAGVNFTNVTAGSAISLIGNTAAVDIQHKNAGLTGSADSVTISMVGNTGNVTVDSDGAQDIELATLAVEGVNTGNYTIGDSAASTITTLTVTGTGSIDLEAGGDLNTALATLDASANSGGVTFTSALATGTTLTGGSGNDVLTGATGNDVVSGGAGNDTLTLTAGKDNISGGAGDDVVVANGADKDDTISGGDGTDTISLNAALSYDDESTPTVNDAANISGFETLRNEAAFTQDMAALSGITVVEGESGVLTMTESGVITDFHALDASVGLDVTLATASNTTADNLNIHIGEATAQANATGVTVDAIQYETALVHSKGADGNTITDFEADGITALTVTGNKTLSVTLNDSAAVSTLPLTTVDASAFTGSSLTVSAVEADSGVTITTGSSALVATVGDGANSITGTSGDDEITTGSGADTISTSDGEDDISAGDGANTITVGGGNATIAGGEGVDTITAGNGANTITLGDGADVVTVGTGNNNITNAAGNATITAGDGENTVTNTAGNSTITLGDGGNTVNLTAGNSTVVTGALADTITVTAGNNDITSGAGNDTITLGSGNDTVDAGTGTDTVAYSVSQGTTWAGSISDAETVTATYTGSATIDVANVSGYDTLNVTASADTATTTLNNLGSATVNLTDDSVEGSGAGDIEAMVIDATDDASITVSVGANQNAATAVAADLASLTITDAASVTLKSTGGSFGHVLANDFESVVLDDEESTSVTIIAEDYTSIAEAVLTGTESIQTLTVDAEGAESDITLGATATNDAMNTISLTADGLNSTASIAQIGDAEAATAMNAVLSTLSVTASNSGTVDFHNGFNGDYEEGDISTTGDLTSYTLTASGESSTIEAGTLSADGSEVGTFTISATDGATIDSNGAVETAMNWGFTTMSITASGSGAEASTVESELVMDEGAITASDEATISILSTGTGSTVSLEEANLGAVDLDDFSLQVGSYANLDADETDVEVDDDLTTIDLDFDSDSNFEGDLDFDVAGIVTNLQFTMGEEASFPNAEGAGNDVVDLVVSGGSDTEVGIKTLTVDITAESAVVVDTTSTNLITLTDEAGEAAASHVVVGDSEGEGSDIDFYNGSVSVNVGQSSTANVNISNVLDAAELDVAGAESSSSTNTFGSWTVNTGEGADTVTGGAGVDTINTNDGADTITGAAGNDVITSGNGADTVDAGAGADSIILTESVSAADVVQVSAVVGTSSDSAEVAGTGFIDSGEDTITTFTAGTDTIEVTLTNVVNFVHGTNTDLGEGDATSEGDDSNSYATNVGLINTNGASTDEFGDASDILINFASPTTTMTEALFEAALQYNITGTAAANTITGGALADTINGGDLGDALNGGGGADDFLYDAFGDGSSAAAEGGTFSGFDTITGFVAGTDDIDIEVTVDSASVVVAGADVASAEGSDLTSANYTDHDAVLGFINDANIEDLIESDGDYDAEAEYFFGVTITGVGTVLYEIIDGDVNTVQDGAVALVAVVSDATLTHAADFI